jgi:hypothetical protein
MAMAHISDEAQVALRVQRTLSASVVQRVGLAHAHAQKPNQQPSIRNNARPAQAASQATGERRKVPHRWPATTLQALLAPLTARDAVGSMGGADGARSGIGTGGRVARKGSNIRPGHAAVQETGGAVRRGPSGEAAQYLGLFLPRRRWGADGQGMLGLAAVNIKHMSHF